VDIDLSSLKDRDLAVLYCGVWIADVKVIPVGVRSKEALDRALFEELERRHLTTLDAARIAEAATSE
jgi:hypothetical protein